MLPTWPRLLDADGPLEKNECSTAKLEKVTAKQAIDHLAYYRGAASFAVLHLKGMTTALKKQYYASAE
jgi:hypothetical protein